ncbi:hypothetical protein LGN17_22455 [Burkholderia sp. AU30280]|uniref:hypothetical protein n=1 Tax=Burkholderia sp. AU30280 TaxID=2879628 RepID=UPI001CF3738B|nr:hypothetical protein [Burkholderia sp. AU30280]MCA8275252.1 hypothetical protein [Burkholderia sp. AU30280]
MANINSDLGASENPRFTPEYREGVVAALDKLRAWTELSLPKPPELARQWEAGVFARNGDERVGFSETIAAYLWVSIECGSPCLDRWKPLDDIDATDEEVSHG